MAGTRNASLGQVDKLRMQFVCRETLLTRAAEGCEDVVLSISLYPFPEALWPFKKPERMWPTH